MANKIRIQDALAEVQRKIDEQNAQRVSQSAYGSSKKSAKDIMNKAKNNQVSNDTFNDLVKSSGATPSKPSSDPIKDIARNAGASTTKTAPETPAPSKAPVSTPTVSTPAPTPTATNTPSSSSATGTGSTGKYPSGSWKDTVHTTTSNIANSKIASGAGKLLGVASIPLMAYDAKREYDDRVEKGQTVKKAAGGAAADLGGSLAGGIAGGALTGAAAGALTGPFAPIAAPIGAVIGGVAGAMGGSHLAKKAYDYATGADDNKPEDKVTRPRLNDYEDVPAAPKVETPKAADDNKVPRPRLNDYSPESGPKKKKVNEALLVAFHRVSNKINR
jgi:hypothetical protein